MIDWQPLKREVIIFAVTLVLALVLSGVLLSQQLQTVAAWQQARSQRDAAQSRFVIASDQKKLLQLYQQPYQALQDRAVIGEEQRIHWVETIQAASTRHGIPSVKFSISQRQLATLPDDMSGVALFSSHMRLEMNLLHEGDLFNLLADLDNRAQGKYGIQSCSLKRAGEFNPGGAVQNMVGANCDLLWYSMSQPLEQQYDDNGEPIVAEQHDSDEGGE